MADLGRYRRGDKLTLHCATPSVPDHAPIAVILDQSNYPVAALSLPKADASRKAFELQVFVGDGFALGSYSVSYQFSVGGVPGNVPGDSFTVIAGGDSGGEVISLYSCDRPEARFVIAQLNSGRLVRGRNPSI
jgi:hypothetical protein